MSNATRPAPPWKLAGRSPLTRLPELVIPSRFCGPAGSGNGGYVCGRIAAYADGPLAVTLRRPPPLATAMTVEPVDDGSLCVRHGGTLIAEATSPTGPLAVEVPDLASLADARRSAGASLGRLLNLTDGILGHGMRVLLLLTSELIVGTFSAFFSPARTALLPNLVHPDQLLRANAMTNEPTA